MATDIAMTKTTTISHSSPPGDSSVTDTALLVVEGVPNFRDLGGKPCAPQTQRMRNVESHTQQYIREGYIFRCAQPTQITTAGIATLTCQLGVRHTYDLRSAKELRLVEARYKGVVHEIPGVTRHHVPIYQDDDYSPISMAEKYNIPPISAEGHKPPVETGRGKDGFIDAYEDILRQAGVSGSFRSILWHVLQKPQEPLAWHCTLGKDRTGIFAALLLKLCGVKDELVVQDYALTTQGLGKWREYLVKRLMDGAAGEYARKTTDGGEEIEKRPPTKEEAERVIGSHAEDMWAFLEMLEKKFGGARQYFQEMCDLTDEELDDVVEIVVVGKDKSEAN